MRLSTGFVSITSELDEERSSGPDGSHVLFRSDPTG